MRFYSVVESNSPTLTVATIGLARLKMLIQNKMEVRWSRDGEVRVVPLHILRNVYYGFKDGMKQVEPHRLGEALAHAHTIKWEQTLPLPDAPVEVVFNPRPAAGEYARKRRTEDGVTR